MCVIALLRIMLKLDKFLMCYNGSRCNRHGRALKKLMIKKYDSNRSIHWRVNIWHRRAKRKLGNFPIETQCRPRLEGDVETHHLC